MADGSFYRTSQFWYTKTHIMNMQYCHKSQLKVAACRWPPVALSVLPLRRWLISVRLQEGFRLKEEVGVSFSSCTRWISTHQCTGSRDEVGGGGRFSNVKSVEINEAACEDESLLPPTLLPPPPRVSHILRLQQHNLSLPIITSTFPSSLSLVPLANNLPTSTSHKRFLFLLGLFNFSIFVLLRTRCGNLINERN